MRNQAPLVASPVTEALSSAGSNAGAGRDVVSAFKELWVRGTPVDVNAFLAEHPELAGRKSAVLDLAYEEYCQRREKGLAVDADAFCAAIPRFKTSLRRLLEADRCLAEQSGGEAAVPVRWPEPGDDFLGFALQRELGRGAFARVFLARQPALGDRQVVVKVSWHGADEARTLGRLAHPNVVPVYSVQKEELSGLTAICMPYLGHATLCDVLDHAFSQPRAGRRASTILEAIQGEGEPPENLPPPVLLRHGTYVDGIRLIAAQLAEALDFLHRLGICHRDLKPSNVLLTPHGRPVLLDFNLSFDARRAEQRFGGTLPYMAPEHLRAVDLAADAQVETANPRSDLFAFGVLVYELLTGEHPFGPITLNGSALELRARLLERQRRGPAPLPKGKAAVPTAVARVIERCLAYDPAERPESAAEVAAILRRGVGVRLVRCWMTGHRRLLAQATLGVAIVLAMAVGLGNLYSWLAAAAERSSQPAWDAYRAGRFDEAVRTFSQTLDAHPTFTPAYYGRGRAYLRLGRLELAEADFQEADRLASDGRTSACLGYCRNLLGRHGAAALHYEEAIEAGFASAEVYNNLGYSYLESYGRLDKARASLAQAICLNDRLQAAYYNRVRAELRDAERNPHYVPLTGFGDMEKAILLGPESAELFFDAARLAAIQEGRRATVAPPKPELLPLKHPLEYLQMALERGLNPALLENRAFCPWRQDPRFLKLLSASVSRQPFPKPVRVLDPVHD